MSRTVKFRRPSPGAGHERSDSGFSDDCDSRASNHDQDYLADVGLYSIRQALETAHQETDKWRAKAEDLERELKELRNDLEQTKANMRAIKNASQVEIDSLTKDNKDLLDQNAQLQDTIKELKKTNRKSSSGSSPSTSSATASESSDEKKVRRSASRRPKESGRSDKERDRGREREKDSHKERERERRREKDKERAAQEKAAALEEENRRLRQRFDRGDESDAKSSSTSTRNTRHRSDESYIEPLGHGAPRPSAPVPPSPSRQYSSYPATTASTYPAAPAYASIREPFGTAAPRSHHPTVYVQDDFAGYSTVGDEDAAAAYHVHAANTRSSRHPR